MYLVMDNLIPLATYLHYMPLFSSSHQQWGQTPVYIASERGHDTITKMLIEAKADVNHPDEV